MEKINIYEIVTEQILEFMAQGFGRPGQRGFDTKKLFSVAIKQAPARKN
jgi:hypothetical protein